MGIDVFFCSILESDFLREAIADLCLRRWMQIRGVNLIEINDDILGCSPLEFQRLRRIYAEENTTSNQYAVADDDCFLLPDFNPQSCIDIMKRHPEFASISLKHMNCNWSDWSPDGYVPQITSSVAEHYAAGGIRFCQKGYITHWKPIGDGPGYDTLHGEAIRNAGYKVGYFRNFQDFHLGEGLSSIWKPQAVTA